MDIYSFTECDSEYIEFCTYRSIPSKVNCCHPNNKPCDTNDLKILHKYCVYRQNLNRDVRRAELLQEETGGETREEQGDWSEKRITGLQRKGGLAA